MSVLSPARRADRWARAGFTLVELILVMGLLAAVMAMAAPSLSRFFRGRNLAGEAGRFLALTEFARSEAVSQGLAAAIWIEPETRRFGVETRTPWEDAGRARRSYQLQRDVAFQSDNLSGAAGQEQEVIVFAPDGFLEADSIQWIGFEDGRGEVLYVQQTTNRWAYEISRELRNDLEG
jgi:type II secretion system protein H